MSKPKHNRPKPHEAEIDRLKKDLVCAKAWIETWKLAAEEVQRRRDEKEAEVKRLRDALPDLIEIAEEYVRTHRAGGLSTHNEESMIEAARAALGKGEA